MKLTITVTQPQTLSLTLREGDVYSRMEPTFNPLIQEIGKHKLVGSDTDDWEWRDFFHHSQIPAGGNGSAVEFLQVLNVNNGCNRITLKLVYGNDTHTIAIIQYPY